MTPAPDQTFVAINPVLAWMRSQSISAPALLALSWSFTAVMASLLLWAGIAHDWVRAILFLLVAIAAYTRRLCGRLGAVAPIDGKDGPLPATKGRRWGELAEQAIILLAAGFCAFARFEWIGPLLGGLAAVLLLAGGVVARHRPGLLAPPRPDPALTVTAFGLVSGVEELWGWRGQTMLIGLLAISAILVFWLVRQMRVAPR